MPRRLCVIQRKVIHQHRIGGGIARFILGVGGVLVDECRKPEQLTVVVNLVNTVHFDCRLVVRASRFGTEAVLIKCMFGLRVCIVCPIDIDNAVGGIQYGIRIRGLPVVQILPPDSPLPGGRFVEQEAHLAGSKRLLTPRIESVGCYCGPGSRIADGAPAELLSQWQLKMDPSLRRPQMPPASPPLSLVVATVPMLLQF